MDTINVFSGQISNILSVDNSSTMRINLIRILNDSVYILSEALETTPVLDQKAGNVVRINKVEMPIAHGWISVKEYKGMWLQKPQFGKHMGQEQFDNESTLLYPKNDPNDFEVDLHSYMQPGKDYAVIYYTDKLNDGMHINEDILRFETFTAR
jgi:hypothetical protein